MKKILFALSSIFIMKNFDCDNKKYISVWNMSLIIKNKIDGLFARNKISLHLNKDLFQ